MKVLDPGHRYELDHLDSEHGFTCERLQFVKRIGEKFPGNQEPRYEGTTTQEVIRALIDRTKYVNAQRPSVHNLQAIRDLRSALVEFEMRAAHERDESFAICAIVALEEPELAPICAQCGHILCTRGHM